MKLAKKLKGIKDAKVGKVPALGSSYSSRPITLNADKGDFDGSCNRTACQRPGSRYWNRHMNAYYCRSCALAIDAGLEPGAQCFPGKTPDTEDRRKAV